MSFLYLYALLLERPAGAFSGLGGEPVRFIPAGGLLAAAGELAEVPRAGPDALRGHESAVRRIWESSDALLPARFGEVLQDMEALETSLSRRRDALREALDLVRGREQMTLRVFGEASGDQGPLEELERDVIEGPGGPGTRYLLERRRTLRASGEVPEIARLRDTLAPLVAAERVERHRHGLLLATVHHLVPRGDGTLYAEAVARERSRSGAARLAVSGPWPPYAFAPEAP